MLIINESIKIEKNWDYLFIFFIFRSFEQFLHCWTLATEWFIFKKYKVGAPCCCYFHADLLIFCVSHVRVCILVWSCCPPRIFCLNIPLRVGYFYPFFLKFFPANSWRMWLDCRDFKVYFVRVRVWYHSESEFFISAFLLSFATTMLIKTCWYRLTCVANIVHFESVGAKNNVDQVSCSTWKSCCIDNQWVIKFV